MAVDPSMVAAEMTFTCPVCREQTEVLYTRGDTPEDDAELACDCSVTRADVEKAVTRLYEGVQKVREREADKARREEARELRERLSQLEEATTA